MSHCVSYEMALRLKAAGFPQPEPTPDNPKYFFYSNRGKSLFYTLAMPNTLFIFAPTVADILPLLPGLHVWHNCYKFQAEIFGTSFFGNNIHNVAALAWLHQNESK